MILCGCFIYEAPVTPVAFKRLLATSVEIQVPVVGAFEREAATARFAHELWLRAVHG